MIIRTDKTSRVIVFLVFCALSLFFCSCGGDYSSGTPVADSETDTLPGTPDDETPDDQSGNAQDGQEPVVFELTQPPTGAEVSGSTSILAEISSGAIDRVVFYLDGTELATDSTPPYEYTWDTTGDNGTHIIRVVVYDIENISYEKTRSVTVNNTVDELAPVILTDGPSAGSFLYGTVSVSATITDNIQLSTVTCFVDSTGYPVASGTDLYSYSWDSEGVSNGEHTLRFEATDTSGNKAVSDTTKVFILNRNEAGCPGSASTWDLTGVWATTIGDESSLIYLLQSGPCTGTTFTAWGYNPDDDTFSNLPGTITGNDSYELNTSSWPRQKITEGNSTYWLQIDKIYWIPDNGGNTFQGAAELSLYWSETGTSNAFLPSLDDVDFSGVRE